MATTYHNDIQKLYVAYFGRPADPAGLAHWETQVEAANGSTAAVSAQFAASAEYKSTYAGMTTSQIVDAVYKNLFGRTAEAGGKAYWADLLDKKTISIDNFVADVAKAAVGTDATAFNNKATAAIAFTNALDTDAKKAGYSLDSIKLAKDYIAGVTTNATLTAATTPAALNKTIADVVAAGTEFTLAAGLQSLEASIAAKEAYLKSLPKDADGKAATEDSVEAARVKAEGDFKAEFAKQATTAANTTYNNPATSDAVKTALINDQVSINAQKLVTEQRELATVTADIAKVTGLQSAINKLTAAKASQENAVKAETAAELDVQVKAASFKVTAASKLADLDLVINANGSVVLMDKGTDAVPPDEDANGDPIPNTGSPAVPPAVVTTLVKADANGALSLNVTEKDYPGITALMTSVNAELIAGKTAENAAIVVKGAQDAITAIDKGGLAVNYEKELKDVAAAEKAITDFTKALSALTTAEAHADALAGYNATIDAAGDLFAKNDFNLVDLDASLLPSEVATVDSDVYVVGTKGATINLFGLQGEDSLFVGTGYTLNTGALSTGDNSKLEIFVSQTGANTTLQIETSVFGSSASTPEVVKIVLVGVTATDIELDANGIITV
jgi:hypothetical protein